MKLNKRNLKKYKAKLYFDVEFNLIMISIFQNLLLVGTISNLKVLNSLSLQNKKILSISKKMFERRNHLKKWLSY